MPVRLEKTKCQLCLRELCPDGGMIGRIIAFAHFAIDPHGGATFGQGFACEDRIDTESAIFLKRQHPIIPPTKKTAFDMMDAKGIAQTHLFERAKSGAFFLRTHNGAAPKARIMHITVFRRDIEISAYN